MPEYIATFCDLHFGQEYGALSCPLHLGQNTAPHCPHFCIQIFRPAIILHAGQSAAISSYLLLLCLISR